MRLKYKKGVKLVRGMGGGGWYVILKRLKMTASIAIRIKAKRGGERGKKYGGWKDSKLYVRKIIHNFIAENFKGPIHQKN